MTFTLRPVTSADLPAIRAMQARVETHDRLPYATSLAEFEEWFGEPHLDPARDTRLVEADGAPVAWGRIWHQPGGEREERAYLPGAVDPDARGRGVGRALLAWQMGRAREILLAGGAALPRYVRTHVYDFQHGAIRLFRRSGMTPVRYVDEMLRDLEAVPPPVTPAGIRIVPWDPTYFEPARAAMNDAFRDHWGSAPRDRATWKHDLERHGIRLDLTSLALDRELVVGVCRNGHFPDDEALTGRRDGWIAQVGVVRSHRKQGIASALIGAALEAFRQAGLTHAALGVDSENPTGANSLYERLGFRTQRRAVVHQIEARNMEQAAC